MTLETAPQSRTAAVRPLKPKLADVARAAGVAVSTASAILANKPYCYASDQTRQQVLDAANLLGYRPNRMARGIRNQQTQTIGLIVSSLRGAAVTLEKVQVIEDLAWEAGYSLIIGTHKSEPIREEACVREFLSRCVDGLIFQSTGKNPDLYAQIIEHRFPAVLTDTPVDVALPRVAVDRELGGYLQVKHLLDSGRSRLLFVGTDHQSATSATKRAGHARALREAGFDPAPRMVVSPDRRGIHPVTAGYQFVQQAIKSGWQFDGMVCNSDAIAVGGMRALLDAGRRIPQDVAVVGFDDDGHYVLSLIPLTTVAQPRDVGQVAFDLLGQQLADKNAQAKLAQQPAMLSPSLVVRQTTANPAD